MEAVEPRGTVFERRDLRDEWLYADRARGKKFDGFRILTRRSTRTLQANLATDYFLQMDSYFGGEIADESDGAAFANGVDAVSDGFGAADGFENGVNADVVGEFENLRGEIRFGVEDFGGAEIFCHFKARVVDVGDEDAICAGGAEGLKNEKADHAGADDESGVAVIDRSDLDGVEGDGGRFKHGGFSEWEIVGKAVDDAGGDDDIFGEGAGATVVAARDAEDLAIVAEIDVATTAVGAFAAEDGGVEGDALADTEIFHVRAEGGDAAGGFVTHYERRNSAAGGTVEAVDVAAADAAGSDFDEDFVGGWGGFGGVGDFEVVVLGEEEGFHFWLALARVV